MLFLCDLQKVLQKHSTVHRDMFKVNKKLDWISKNRSNPANVYLLKFKSKINALNLSKVDIKYIKMVLLDVALVSSVHHYISLMYVVKLWLWIIATNKYHMTCTCITEVLATTLLTLSMTFPTWNRTPASMCLMLDYSYFILPTHSITFCWGCWASYQIFKKGGLTGSQVLEEGCLERDGWLFPRVAVFTQKIN